jgi:hypothetical protein
VAMADDFRDIHNGEKSNSINSRGGFHQQ